MSSWSDDVLSGFEARTIDLIAEDDGELVATIVRKLGTGPSKRCAIYVHGYSDYFFQTHLAESYLANHIDFYAIDRRRCGRSLRPGNRPNYVEDLADYFAELAQVVRIAVEEDGHDEIVLHGHSEGGLVAALFTALDPAASDVTLLALNSPWLDVKLPPAQKLGWWISKHFGQWFPRKEVAGGLSAYVDSIHRDFRGEWDFDLEWKPRDESVVYPAWARAVARGHDAVQGGLDIKIPILVQHSDRSSTHSDWDDELMFTDSILDIDQIHDRSSNLGSDLTIEVVDDAMHDLVLSAEPVRTKMLAGLQRWVDERFSATRG